ncbi:hypothetical protein, partial [Streptomyces sp. NPDC058572]|uniref:hypothetical protein n=1 Tax=Streptomyces sp. NPDC058572 TaxID=3346546 RepID=UPI0036627A78
MLSNMILPFFLSTVMFFGPAQFVSLLPGQARFVTIVTFDQVTAAVNTLPATPSFGSAVPTALTNRTTPSFGVALLKRSHLDYNQEVPFVLIDMVKVLLLVAVALGLL